jgi:hypothetical protein
VHSTDAVSVRSRQMVGTRIVRRATPQLGSLWSQWTSGCRIWRSSSRRIGSISITGRSYGPVRLTRDLERPGGGRAGRRKWRRNRDADPICA